MWSIKSAFLLVVAASPAAGFSSRRSAGGNDCPPSGFDSAAGFSLSRYISAPWYSIAQLPLTYQPASTLFCVRALYVEVEAANKTARTIDVYNEARRGGIKGEPVDTPDLVAHPDDLPDAAANEATRASKLRVGLAVFDHIYGYNASMQPADANTRLAEMMPADNEALISEVDKATLIQLLKALLFGPYWVVFVSEDYQWAIVTGGPPTKPSNDKCTTATIGINNVGVWLLHRDPEPPANVVEQMRNKAEELGLDTSTLQKVTQSGCTYTPPCELTGGQASWCRETTATTVRAAPSHHQRLGRRSDH